jgi:hypothetical protein
MQIVAPTIGAAWFDPDDLRTRTIAKHGAAGAQCSECGVWRWYPLLSEEMPPYPNAETMSMSRRAPSGSAMDTRLSGRSSSGEGLQS